MNNVKIGDKVMLVTRVGSLEVSVTDVIRDCFSGSPIALEFSGKSGLCTLPISYFKAL